MSKTAPALVLLLLSVGLTDRAIAHYLWLEAIPASNNQNGITEIDVRIGHDFPGRQVANNLRYFEAFDYVMKSRSSAVLGAQGREPAGYVENDGIAFSVVYRSVKNGIRMTGKKFAEYIEEEGLQNRLNQLEVIDPESEIREAYTHQAVLKVADSAGVPVNELSTTGLLIRPLTKSPSNMVFNLMFNGNPVSGAPITLVCKDETTASTRLFTDQDGSVTFTQLCTGNRYLRSIYLRSLNDSDTEWESHWATLTIVPR